jgi:NAD(P)-dependent dehydrogenase (short-subunit alcohol dehydrogenase family)
MTIERGLKLEGRVAAVTGAGKGLGRAYALWLARHGCGVVVNNRTHPGVPSSARKVVEEISLEGGQAIAYEAAVDDPTAAGGLVSSAIERFGKLDIVICNAGIMPEGPFAAMAPETLAQTVSVNLLGTLYPLQAAWRHMLERGYGRIVLTGSTVGAYGHSGVAAYGATRAAVIGLARSLASEVPADANIRINVIMPFAYTGMSAASIDAAMDPAVVDAISPEQIAPIVGWLCSEDCPHTSKIFHASALRVSRIGLIESEPVIVDPRDLAALSRQSFDLGPAFEPQTPGTSVARLLS